MRWPWAKRDPEKRQSGGAFYDLVLRQIEAQAEGAAQNISSTAAVEAAAGALSRAFASAEVQGAGVGPGRRDAERARAGGARSDKARRIDAHHSRWPRRADQLGRGR